MNLIVWCFKHWLSLVVIACVFCFVIYLVRKVIKMSNDEKMENLREWLKWAVTMAEKDLGSGTGELKLRLVYNMAIEKFPWVATLITFETFKTLVTEALEWMNQQIDTNDKVKEYIEGESMDAVKVE